jgi:hypothetical protein
VSSIDRLTDRLVRKGLREGLLGGSGQWLAVGAVAWLVRFLRRKPQRRVVTEKLKLGETIVVTHTAAPPFGRKARKLDKAARAEAATERKQVKAERKKAKPLEAETSDRGERARQ